MGTVTSMKIIPRAGVFIAAVVVVPFAVLAASGCGSVTTAVGGTAGGLEHKTPAQVLRAAEAALVAAGSYHLVATRLAGGVRDQLDLRVQGTAISGTITTPQGRAYATEIGNASYIKADQAVWRTLGAPPAVQRLAGRWIKLSGDRMNLEAWSASQIAAAMTRAYSHRHPEPTVTLATLGGAQVVVIKWRDGSKLYVADTGPAYALRSVRKWTYKGAPAVTWSDFTEYGTHSHITAPSNAVDLTSAG